MSEYDLSSSQITFEPGADDQMLANKLGITNPTEMDEAGLVLPEKLLIPAENVYFEVTWE